MRFLKMTLRLIIDIIDKDAYKAKMKRLISDPSKFKKLDIQSDKHLNFILDKERKLNDILLTII